jgi:response regulator of citrate/malate metabolism
MDVLVVDDDFMVARVHARFVERTEGFRVVAVAHTGEEALRLAAEHDPDLVLLDVHLPDVSGVEVLRRMRAEGVRAGVVMVTAERDAEVVREALHGGAMQYLVKPFEQDDLARRLESVRDAMQALDAGPVDQRTIDRAFVAAAPSPTPAGPTRRLSPETTALVLEALRRHDDVSASECGEEIGISRVSARRYLEQLVTEGRAVVRLAYGRAGRPERRYSRP